MKKKTDKM